MIYWYFGGYIVVAQFVIGYLHALYGRQGSQVMQVVYGVLWPISLPFMVGRLVEFIFNLFVYLLEKG